ncbi:hypothetical protein [Paenibacillus tyrfis]|uniref:hypothetical protein n=1 Tax=Paenibacillus tyrfis TaxID=1501230 RepID=UPI00209E81DC|nr:hypothetical protein [Paenibacillus tyrfis]MCP1308112.1 hypothetical protein [Paenibacillus tyrfis]
MTERSEAAANGWLSANFLELMTGDRRVDSYPGNRNNFTSKAGMEYHGIIAKDCQEGE